MWLWFFSTVKPENVFTSTTELSGVSHTDSWVFVGPCTAGGDEIGGWLGVTQGDNVKLRHAVISGESLGERSLPSSSTTEIDGSDCTGVAMLISGAVSDWRVGHPSGWVMSESTSFTCEKQRETLTVSFLSWNDWGVPRWDFGACAGVWLRVRRSRAGVWMGGAGEAAAALTGVCASARDRRVTLLGER